jgi:leader peptidase (prepilin peptidase)/N-methyltransferase
LLVELLTGALFVFVALQHFAFPLIPLYLLLMAVLVVVIAYDMLHTIIPDECVIAVGALALLISSYHAYMIQDIATFIPRVGAGILAFLFFGGLWYFSQGRWVGFGDAKLAAPLGLLLSWPAVASGIIFAFWVGAGVGLTVMALAHVVRGGQRYLPFLPRSLTMKSEVPFAPFLIIGFFLAHFCGLDAFALVGSLMY